MSIELRSEKTRKMIGRIPNILVRYGVGILSTVVIIVVLLLYLFPYITTLEVPVTLYSEPSYITGRAPMDGIIYFNKKQKIAKGEIICSIKRVNDSVNIISNFNGFIQYLVKNQSLVTNNEKYCEIIPLEISYIYGICHIPKYNIKDLKLNHKIVIELNTSIEHEYINKQITGFISNINPISDDSSSHSVEVRLLESNNANLLELVKKTTMTGSAKIELSNKPILKRLLRL